MNLQNGTPREFLDILFQGKNKSYGAYDLRKHYNERARKALFMALGLVSVLFLSVWAIQRFFPDTPVIFSQTSGRSIAPVELLLPSDAGKHLLPKKPAIEPEPRQNAPIVITRKDEVPEQMDKPEKEPEEISVPEGRTDGAGESTGSTGEGRGEDRGEPSTLPPVSPVPDPQPEPAKPEAEVPVAIPDEDPYFPGGDEALQKFLASNIQYPEIARNTHIEGNILVRFEVSKTGEIKDIKVLRGIGGGCVDETVRVLKIMPKWKPGKVKGKAVSSFFTLPVQFTLE